MNIRRQVQYKSHHAVAMTLPNCKSSTVPLQSYLPRKLQLGRNEAFLLELAGLFRLPILKCTIAQVPYNYLKLAHCRPCFLTGSEPNVFCLKSSIISPVHFKNGCGSILIAALWPLAASISPEKSLLRSILRPETFVQYTAIAIFQSVYHHGPFCCNSRKTLS